MCACTSVLQKNACSSWEEVLQKGKFLQLTVVETQKRFQNWEVLVVVLQKKGKSLLTLSAGLVVRLFIAVGDQARSSPLSLL